MCRVCSIELVQSVFLHLYLCGTILRFSEHMQLFHPDHAKELLDSLGGHIPLHVKASSEAAAG